MCQQNSGKELWSFLCKWRGSISVHFVAGKFPHLCIGVKVPIWGTQAHLASQGLCFCWSHVLCWAFCMELPVRLRVDTLGTLILTGVWDTILWRPSHIPSTSATPRCVTSCISVYVLCHLICVTMYDFMNPSRNIHRHYLLFQYFVQACGLVHFPADVLLLLASNWDQ